MRNVAFLFLLGLAAGTPGLAEAAEWRFCLAQDPGHGRVVLTRAFESAESLDQIETAFNAWLTQAGIRHEWGVCPRSASQTGIDADRRSAIQYNREIGFSPSEVAWPSS